MASRIPTTSLPSLSVRGMSHENLIIKLKEVADENLKLLQALERMKSKLTIAERHLRVSQRQLVDQSLHPGIRHAMAQEGKTPRTVLSMMRGLR